MSDIAPRSVGVSPGADSGNCIVVKPAGLSIGDLMIAHIFFRNDDAISKPGDWSEIRQEHSEEDNISSGLFWKIADSDDVSADNFTFTGTSSANLGTISAWTGHDATTPINADNGQFNTSSLTVTSPSITPSVANCMILMFACCNNDFTFSAYAIADDDPGGWTEAYDILTTEGLDGAVAMGYDIRPETTNTGLGTATLSNYRENIGQLVAIAPLTAQEYEFNSNVIVGAVATASRLVESFKTSSVIVGVVAWAEHFRMFIYSSLALIGVKATASRSIDANRTSPALVGVAPTASRAVEASRTSQALVGILATAARTIESFKSSAVIIAVKATATKFKTITKSSQVIVGVVATGWYARIRTLAIHAITTQCRSVKAFTSQYRIVKVMTAKYRRVVAETSNYRAVKALTALYRKVRAITGR